jgi:hypothetical protein
MHVYNSPKGLNCNSPGHRPGLCKLEKGSLKGCKMQWIEYYCSLSGCVFFLFIFTRASTLGRMSFLTKIDVRAIYQWLLLL